MMVVDDTQFSGGIAERQHEEDRRQRQQDCIGHHETWPFVGVDEERHGKEIGRAAWAEAAGNEALVDRLERALASRACRTPPVVEETAGPRGAQSEGRRGHRDAADWCLPGRR